MPTKQIILPRRWWQRGAANHGWLRSFFTFSFSGYYDPKFVSFGPLRVINEDRVAPKTGFPTHPHSNAEIFSYILSGELTHKDSMGNVETLKRGEVQFTSAGKGIRHSEYNSHANKECHFLQIWYTPNRMNLSPKYYTLPQVPDAEKTDKFMTLIKDVETFSPAELEKTGLLPEGRAIPAHCSLVTRACILTPGHQVEHTIGQESVQTEGEERWVYLHMSMAGGYKDPTAFEGQMRKDIAGYKSKGEQVTRAARFCRRVYNTVPQSTKLSTRKGNDKPRVTLTYAQSRDGYISGPDKKQVSLSGEASMIMTHSLRSMHEGILVGIGTLLSDDPQLNTRHLPTSGAEKENGSSSSTSSSAVEALPRPIVLDSKLQTPVTCKLLANAQAGAGRAPLIIAAKGCEESKVAELEKAGAEVIQVEASSDILPWTDILQAIGQAGIKSVMVEGGANVIESLFAADEKDNLIDELIVTVAPVTLGKGATGYKRPSYVSRQLGLPDVSPSPTSSSSQPLQPINLEPEIFNKDFVFAWSRDYDGSQARIQVQGQVLEEGDGVFIKGSHVGEQLRIENIGHQNAEFLLFDVQPGSPGDDDDY